jgi:IS1 family transposase
LGKIVAFVIGNKRDCAFELFCKASEAVGKIQTIYTDANSCYAESFAAHSVYVRHEVALFKNKTHLIEATNSSMRDNLARFNRVTKRYTKSIEMLDCTLKLFCHHKQFHTS